MPREITAEQRREWAAKAGKTNSERRRHERERWRQQEAEREQTIAVLRQIRDSDKARQGERLQAIQMLSELLPKY